MSAAIIEWYTKIFSRRRGCYSNRDCKFDEIMDILISNISKNSKYLYCSRRICLLKKEMQTCTYVVLFAVIIPGSRVLFQSKYAVSNLNNSSCWTIYRIYVGQGFFNSGICHMKTLQNLFTHSIDCLWSNNRLRNPSCCTIVSEWLSVVISTRWTEIEKATLVSCLNKSWYWEKLHVDFRGNGIYLYLKFKIKFSYMILVKKVLSLF